MEDVEEMAMRELFARATVGDEPPLGALIEDAHRAAVATRRRRVMRATGGFAAVAVLAAAVAASGALTGPGSAGPPSLRTAAYVTGRAERAITTASRVLHAESTVTGLGAPGGGRVVIWAYHDRARYEQYRPGSGRLETDTGTAVVDGKLTGVVVTFHPDAWYRVPLGTVTGGPATGCGASALAAAGHNPPDWRSFIRAALRCGAATVAGRAEVGGTATIKVNGLVTIAQGSARLRVRYTLYLNPATYLPVRMVTQPVLRLQDGKASPASFASTEDFQWLPPTAANVAKVSVPIPAGFRETHPRARDQAAGAGRAGPPAGAPARALVLIDGDRVLLAPSARGRVPAAVLPAAPGGLAGSVLRLDAAGQVYEVPGAALPYLGRGLSPGLFEVSALLRLERAGRLPVRVSYHGRQPALPGVTVTSTGRGTATGYLTAVSAVAFGAALDRQFAADHARGSYGADGLFGGGVSVALAGTKQAPAARCRYPKHTLTVNGTNLAGRPDTGDLVTIASLGRGCPVDTKKTFHHGTARFSVPSGRYVAFGDFYDLSAAGALTAERLTVLPQLTVAADTTVRVAERAADSKITMVTPRPASAQDTSFALLRPCPAGSLGWSWTDTVPLWVSPVHRRPTIGSLATITVQALGPASAARAGYEYNIVHTTGGGIIPRLRYRVPAASLGTVHARYHQDVPSAGTAVNVVLLLRDGFSPDLSYPLALPGARTLYLTGGRALIWDLGYVQAGGPAPLPASGGQYETDRIVAAGGQLTENWNTYPLHPAPEVRIVGPSDPQPAVAAASRTADTLSIDITPFSDNQPGHYGAGFAADSRAKVTGSYQIDQNGTRIAGGKAPISAMGFPLFLAQTKLSAQPSVIRFTLNAARTGAAYRLSTASRTVWTWRSAREPGAKLPPDWRCASYWTRGLLGARTCAVQPMMTLLYHVQRLALNGSVPPGRQVLGITVGHLQQAKAAKFTGATVAVSFNNGATWHRATVTGAAGRYRATFRAPAGAFVTLRVSATDAVGGSITETITHGYQIAARSARPGSGGAS